MIVSRVLCEVHSKFHAVTASTSGGQSDDDHVDRVTPLSGTQFGLPCARPHVRLESHFRHLDMDQALDAETLWPSGAIEEIAEFLDGITCASRGGAACSHPRSSRHESFGTRPQPPCGYAAAGHAVRGPCVATRGNGV